MTKNHFMAFSLQFRSIRNFYFLILFCKITPGGHIFFQNGRRRPFWKYDMRQNNRVLPLCAINGYDKYEVKSWTQLETPQALWAFLYKKNRFSEWCQNHRILVIWDLNGYGEYEFDWCIWAKVMACTSVGVRRRRRRRRRRRPRRRRQRRRRRNKKLNTPEMFKFRGYT